MTRSHFAATCQTLENSYCIFHIKFLIYFLWNQHVFMKLKIKLFPEGVICKIMYEFVLITPNASEF